LSRVTDRPLYDKNSGYTVETTIPKERVRLNPDQENEVSSRVSRFRILLQGGTYIFQIGKSIEKMVGHRLQKRYNTKNY